MFLEAIRVAGLYEDGVDEAEDGESPSNLFAGCAQSLANTYQKQWRLDDALQMQKLALRVHRRLHGDEYEDVALSLNNMGLILKNLEKFDRAMKKLGQAHAIFVRLHGEDHPRAAMVLGNMAQVMKRQGRHAEAPELHEKVLEIDSRIRMR